MKHHFQNSNKFKRMFNQAKILRDDNKLYEIKLGMGNKTCKWIHKQAHYLIGLQQLHIEEKCYKSFLPVIAQYIC